MNYRPAVFLDRDGVINHDDGYVSCPKDFRFISGVFAGLRYLQEKGYQLVIITNQSGIARGYFSQEQFFQLSVWMQDCLASEGVYLSGIYHCPHHPQGVNIFAKICQCRKPKPGMIWRAREDLKLDLSRSCLIGDKETDIQAGLQAGVYYCVRITKNMQRSQAHIQATSLLDWVDRVKHIENINDWPRN